MPDWTRSMEQTFEFYIVDPSSWKDSKRITDVEKNTITRDESDETLGSASISCLTDLSDNYVRTYLTTIQDGIRERIPLGTYLYQTPSVQFNGKRQSVDQDGYTPLIELKEKPPQLGFTLPKGENILDTASLIAADKNISRAPVVPGESDKLLLDSFVSDVDDTYLYFLSDLISNADYKFGIDEMGRILFLKNQELASLSPVWTFDDTNSSILYPDIEIERDIYGVPNVVEVIYSPADGSSMYSMCENTDANSIVSIPSRGRRIVYRETNPNVVEGLNQSQLNEYAKQLLKSLSQLEYKVSYKHGYCPVRLGDCVMLNYERAGINMVKARVTRQIIKCENGCPVEETAVYTKDLWEVD